jgi:two-component system sensor histidine kinase RegB
VIGQTATVCWARFGLGLPLPLGPVFGLILFTAFTNCLLYLTPAETGEKRRTLAAVLLTDVVILTEILHFTGGSRNPFSSFYLVHVALAAVALTPVYTGLIAAVCALCFASLFAGRAGTVRAGEVVCGFGPDMAGDLHLKGMLASFVLTAACIAFFAARLQEALRKREREVARLREQSARQEQFAALATLAAGAAHELGTPLGTIAVAAGEIARAAAAERLPTAVAEDARLIREEARRCREILDRLHDKAGDPARRIEASELFERVRERLGSMAALVAFDQANSGVAVHAPAEALVQATVSLIRNAIDAAPPNQIARVLVEPRGENVRLTVADGGAGLGDSVATRAGEPFFTTKPPGSGMGLGLFLVRLLAERLGGSFRLEANQPCGTRAILEIPAPA